MPNYMRYLLLLALLSVSCLVARGQEKCAVPAYRDLQQAIHPQLAGETQFEGWVQQKLREKLLQKKSQANLNRPQKQLYRLPVVVHVIHNGEDVGTGANIPESQILRQIEILNQDFRKLNEDQINQLPADFQAVAADTEIEFVLARQDPEGLPTSGINRLKGTHASYNYETNDYDLKTQVQWPAEDYINIYVATLNGGFIGYAQFPETDQLQGLDQGLTYAQTDGVVIDYRYFGEGGSAVTASRGRTATHELGHYFGLLHTWGDGFDCSSDDHVEDTPFSSTNYLGFSDCSSNPSSCETPDMFQNYMAYTDDACMSLFTQGQKERMIVILQNSPRRRELAQSRALEEPVIVANDAGIRQLTLNLTDSCSKTFTPQVLVRNYGSNTLDQVEISLFIKGERFSNRSVPLTLGYLETQLIELDEIDYSLSGLLQIEAQIVAANNTTDGKAFNNSLLKELHIPERRETPLLEDFEGSTYPFYRINPDYLITWQQVTAPITGNPNNLALSMNYKDYGINFGAKDYLISPIIDLSNESQSYLSFRVAYAPYSRSYSDKLEVYVTTDCSETIEHATLIYSKEGSELATTASTTASFVPAGNEDWRNEFLDLSAFAGNPQVQLLFVGTNDWGNNLYLDDIEVIKQSPYDYDVTLQSINNPAVVSCEEAPRPAVVLRNTGRQPLSSLEVYYTVDGEGERKTSLSGLNIAPMASQQVSLPPLSLAPGMHTLQVRAARPSGREDENPSNNTLAKRFVIDQQQDVIPLRMQFTRDSFLKTSFVRSRSIPVPVKHRRHSE